MKSLAKILLPLAFLTMPLTISAQDSKPAYSKLGMAISTMHNSEIKNNFKTPFGYELIVGKELLPELSAEISINQVFAKEANNSGYKQRINLWGIGPNIIWNPKFNGVDGLYFGAGAKYKIFKLVWNPGPNPTYGQARNDESESIDGLGFSVKFGSEFKLGKKAKLYLETEYDKAKVDQDGENIDLGETKLSIGIKF